MRGTGTTAGLVAAMVLFGTTAAAAAPPAPTSTPDREVLRFLDISRPVGGHDGGRPGEPDPGDVFRFNNLLRHTDSSDAITRQVLGRFPSECTIVEGTQADCEGSLELRDGTIYVAGTPDLAQSPIEIVVTGGTGRYEGVSGTGQLTPTDVPGTSLLTVTLGRPARTA
jgi:hypothetical protein